MAAKVRLGDIVEALESAGDEHSFWLDRETGEVCLLTDQVVDYAEDDTPLEKVPEPMRKDVEVARLVQEDTEHRYLELPGKLDIHDWDIMDCFASTVKDEHLQREIKQSIRGSGAFRMFKRLLEEYKLWDTWNKFHDARLREIAVEWCEDNDVAWREK
jgi:Uncharacterised protein family (UPF0158)